jgi:hypothetical protein
MTISSSLGEPHETLYVSQGVHKPVLELTATGQITINDI